MAGRRNLRYRLLAPNVTEHDLGALKTAVERVIEQMTRRRNSEFIDALENAGSAVLDLQDDKNRGLSGENPDKSKGLQSS